MALLDQIRNELARYEHALVDFSARERADGGIELLIALKQPPPDAHVYVAPVHPRDIGAAQFAWNFQRYLYDCLHDYVVELFIRTPQSKES